MNTKKSLAAFYLSLLLVQLKIFLSRRTVLFVGTAFIAVTVLAVSSVLGQTGGIAAAVTLVNGDPTAIYPGEITHLEITLSNSNAQEDATSVGFSNFLPGTLPNGLKIAGPIVNTCGGTVVGVLDTQLISLSGGTIPKQVNSVDGVCKIVVPVTAGSTTGSAATYIYKILNGAVTGIYSNSNVSVANVGDVGQSINVKPLNLPLITKSFNNSLAIVGGTPRTLTISVSNPNPVKLPNFSLTDVFPVLGGQPIIRVANPANATSSCTAGGTAALFTPSPGDASLTASSGTIAANGSCTLTVQIVGSDTNNSFQTGNRPNTILGSSFTNDLGLIPNNASANINVRSPLSVSKAFAHSTVASGEQSTLSITFTNNGLTPLVINNFTDDRIDGLSGIPAYGLSIPITPAITVNCGAGNISPVPVVVTPDGAGVTLGSSPNDTMTVPAGGNCKVTLPFIGTVQNANTPISFTNTIPQAAVGNDLGAVSQSASASVTVIDTLRVTKSANPGSVAPGNPINYKLTLENWSAALLSNTQVTDTLTNGQTFLTGLIGGINYTPVLSGTGCSGLSTSSSLNDGSAVFTVGTIPARSSLSSPGSCQVSFWAMASPTSQVAKNVLASNQVCENNGAGPVCNGSGSSTTTVNPSPVLAIQKTFPNAGSSLPEGTVTTMHLVLTNQSAYPLTGVSLSDLLPLATAGGGQLIVANPSNINSNCGSPTLTAVSGSSLVSVAGATVPARSVSGTGSAGTCFIDVDVVGPAGTYNNTATVTGGTQTYANGQTATISPVSSSANLTYNSTLSASKSFLPGIVSSGGRSTVTVHLANSGPTPLTHVSVQDPLPAGMVLASPVNAYTSCSGSPSFTGGTGASTITMTGATVNPNSGCDMLFDVTATGSADWVNTIPVGKITADNGITNQTPVTATLQHSLGNDLTVSKTMSPSTLTFPGETSQLTINITNGNQLSSAIDLTDYFTVDGTSNGAPNGMRITSTPTAVTTCPGGIVTALPGDAKVTLTGASLNPNASCTVKVNVTSVFMGGITNFIPVDSIMTSQGVSNANQAATSLAIQNNIGITKTFTPHVVKPGERSRLRINLFNASALPAANMTVTDNLPAGVTVPSGANPITTCVGGSVTSPTPGQVKVSGANLGPASGNQAATCYAEIDVLVASQGDYVNTIPTGALSATVGGSVLNNPIPATDILRAKLPLEIYKGIDSVTQDLSPPSFTGFSHGVATRSLGSPALLKIVVKNPNNQALTYVHFNDVLPAGLVVANTPNIVTTCQNATINALPAGTGISMTGASLPANSSCQVSLNVLSNISGAYVNNIPSGNLTSFEGVANENGTSAKLIIATPPSVTKEFIPAVISAGGKSTLRIVLNNNNAVDATLVSDFVDTLPAGMTVASPNGVGGTCPGTVQAVSGSGSVKYTSGSKIPSPGCYINVDVTASNPGNYINAILAGSLQTDLGNNQNASNATLVVSNLGFISGKVFNDNNNNGIFELGTDTSIPAVSIELREGASCSGTLLSTQLTDSAGNYTFVQLPAGTYSVCQPTQPSGTSNGITSAGALLPAPGSTNSVGSASNPSSTSSQIVSILLGTGTNAAVSGSVNNNFAELLPASISGRVFLDYNNDGLENGLDQGIAGQIIQLTGTDINNNSVSLSVTTDANGHYSFAGLVPGVYTVIQPNQPVGTSNGITSAGNAGGLASNPSATSSQIKSITLAPNTSSLANNFAELANNRSLSGTVFLDYDNNGSLNGTDYGLGGQTLSLAGTDVNGNSVSATAITDSNGHYIFTGLPSGIYTVTQPNQPASTNNGITTAGSAGGTASNPTTTSSQISGISLTGAQVISSGNNFAETPGNFPDLSLQKSHTPSSFAEGSTTGYFVVTPKNIGLMSTSGTVTVQDTLPTGLSLSAPVTGTDWVCVGSVGANSFTCTTSAVIAAGATGNPLTVPIAVAANTAGQLLTNTAVISGGSEPPGLDGNNTALDTVTVTTGARISGHVWRDANHDRILDASESKLSGWKVELLLNNVLVATTTTDTHGAYSFTQVSPGIGYQIRFRDPVTGLIVGYAVTNERGIATINGVRDTGAFFNPGTDTTSNNNPAGASVASQDGTLQNLAVLADDVIIQQSLPLDPTGVVYDAITRNPVAGAQVTISGPPGFNPAQDLVGGSAVVSTGADGAYFFQLTSSAPAGHYTLSITNYPTGYKPVPSALIPVCSSTLNVAHVPSPAVVQNSNVAPPLAVDVQTPGSCPADSGSFTPINQATTQHYFNFNFSPSSANLVNNHIPLDPFRKGDLLITKTTPFINVTLGQLVPYTIVIKNTSSAPYNGVNIIDILPPGFKYKSASATIDGLASEPVITGNQLIWLNQNLAPNTTKTIKLVLIVGVGVQSGQYTNSAEITNGVDGDLISDIATATVRIIPDPLFDCAEIIGKVFDDNNANGYAENCERGIPNVRLATVNGLLVTTDAYGRFHVPCAATPHAERGSNFLMKLDERTLPTGYRLTTENPREVRLTPGKMTKLNFGAAIHKVIRVDVRDSAFIAESTQLKPQWAEQIKQLPGIIQLRPSVVRISYTIENQGESEHLARQRLRRIVADLKNNWREKASYRNLLIEEELVILPHSVKGRAVK